MVLSGLLEARFCINLPLWPEGDVGADMAISGGYCRLLAMNDNKVRIFESSRKVRYRVPLADILSFAVSILPRVEVC